MKTRIFIGLAVCVLCFASVAQATIVQQDFNGLVAGSLDGQAGGTGFGANNWGATGTIDVVHSADLVAPASTNFALTQSAGTAGIVNGVYRSARQVARALDVALTGTVWGSYLTLVDTDEKNGIGFNNTSGTSNVGKPGFDNLSRDRIYYRPLSGAQASADDALTEGIANLVLFRIIIDADGTNDDVTIWTNPDVTDLASETPAIAKATVDFVGSSITGLTVQSWGTGNVGAIDMITLSDGPNAYFDVTGVPEPATMLLLGLGGLTLVRRRRN